MEIRSLVSGTVVAVLLSVVVNYILGTLKSL